MTTLPRLFAAAALVLLAGGSAAEDLDPAGPTPPRLSLIEGQVSFARPNAEEWTTAVLNTPLAVGDALYAGDQAGFEVQFGRRAFVRGGQQTQLELRQLENRHLRFRLAAGQAAFDLHELPDGLAIEVETPNARIAIERGGYYRLNVDQDTTFFGIRRDGRASVVPLGGAASELDAGEELVIEGSSDPGTGVYPIGEVDAWDRWNEERSTRFAEADSAPDLPPDLYGAEALSSHGRWQPEPEYGSVWIPSGVAADWAPYSSGQWVSDPYYGWTWIDHAPWGWAPFHYGRWVFIRGFWAWAPGPRALRSVYSPALVGFVSFRHAPHGHPSRPLGWVALSWGEPLLPWWGRRDFIGRPWWGGWHGPRHIDKKRFDHPSPGHHLRNAGVGHAVVAVPSERFGRGPVHRAPIGAVAPGELTPILGALPVAPHRWAVGRVTPIPPRTSSGVFDRGPASKDFNRVFRPAAPPVATSPPAVVEQPPTVVQPAAPSSTELKVLVPSAPNVVEPVVTEAPPIFPTAVPRFAQPRRHANSPAESRDWPARRSGPPRDREPGEYRDRSSPGPAGGVNATITPRRFAVRPMTPPAGAAMAPIQPIAPVAPIAPVTPFVTLPRRPFVVPPTSSSVPPPSPPRAGNWRDNPRRDSWRDGDRRDDKQRGQGSSGNADPAPAKRGGNASGMGGSSGNSYGVGRSWRDGGSGRR